MAKYDKSGLTRRMRYERIFNQLEIEWSTHRAYWRDLLEFVTPTRERFTITDANRGKRKHQRILNSRAAQDLTVLKAGLMATVTNPSVNWVRFTLADKELAEYGPAKEWLGEVSRIINGIFLKSNLYKCLPTLYGDMATVANGALLIEEDFEDVIRSYNIPVGSYMIAVDDKGKVNKYGRQFRYTVQQLIEKFGFEEGEDVIEENIPWDRFSTKVKELWDGHKRESWVDVVHLIIPNDQYDPSMLESKYKRYLSVYYEKGNTGTASLTTNDKMTNRTGQFLRERGLDLFNILVPRWEVTGEDAYGTNCPAMEAHGPNRALQTYEKRKAQAVEHKVNPTLLWPSSHKKKRASALPGDNVFMDEMGMQAGGVRRLFEVDFDTREVREDIIDLYQMIDAAFHRDAFAPISGQPIQGTPPSAAEIHERASESRMKLGGPTQNVQDDFLEPLVDITYYHAEKQGKIPTPPEEIRGKELKVEFIGILAQSQKTVALGGIRDFTAFTAEVAANTQDMGVWDKVDINNLIDAYAEGSGIENDIVVTDEVVEEIRAFRAQREQAMEAQEAMMNLSGAAKNLSDTDLSGDNALAAIAENAEI